MHESTFMTGRSIIPKPISTSNVSFKKIIKYLESTCFEARNVAKGAKLFEKMISEGYTIWLGIAGAGIVGGLGGLVRQLIKNGFIHVICTTGAQAYHDLHFAWGLPVRQGHPKVNDRKLQEAGIVRIYDTFLSEEGTLLSQDKVVRQFLLELKTSGTISTPKFNFALGRFISENAKFPERSFIASAAECGVPVFYDSTSNHSIGMILAALSLEGPRIELSSDLDILESAAIAYGSSPEGFILLGGGGPKNFIQQTGPMLSQILGVQFEGAEKGIQITTALERDGGLSGCSFNEAITWGKYKRSSKDLVQIFSEYSIVFPLIVGYVIENCRKRNPKFISYKKEEMLKHLLEHLKASVLAQL